MAGTVERYNDYKVTEVKVKEFTYTWRLNNFKYARGLRQDIITEGSLDGKSIWLIYLRPCSDSRQLRLHVFFFKKVLGIDCHYNFFRISIIDKNGVDREMFDKFTDRFNGVNTEYDVNLMTTDALFDKKNIFLQTNGHLILKFRIKFMDKCVDLPKSTYIYPAVSGQQKLIGLANIFNDKKFSDVKLLVGNKELYAYKGILAARSSVFAAMFKHDMKETNESVVKITDIDYEIMREVLCFMYGIETNNIEIMARDLLIAADKYEIQELKKYCEEVLISSLKVDNVINLLIYAETYDVKALKEGALEFLEFHATNCNNKLNEKFIDCLLPALPDVIKSFVLQNK